MVGYTPQLATAVWRGHERPAPLRDRAGRPIDGDGLPARAWAAFVERALAKVPPVAFPWLPSDLPPDVVVATPPGVPDVLSFRRPVPRPDPATPLRRAQVRTVPPKAVPR